VQADNGASQEGGPFGVMHEMKFFNGIIEMPDEAVQRIDTIGGPNSHTNYPWGWAQAGNTPYRWYKQNTHEGGVHVPMVLHWPAGIAADQRGTRRDQFVFVADIVPTIYELVGVEPPTVRRGLEQMPVTGHSFAAVLSDPSAPATNTVQYFENAGSLALIAGEWKAVLKHTPGTDWATEPWELYHLAADRSECHDLAATNPDKLAELVALWDDEAERHGVFPLDDRMGALFGARFRERSPHPENRRYVYRPPMSPLPAQASAAIGGRDVDITAHVTLAPGDEGVLFASGTQNSGISMFVQGGRLVLDYNAFNDHTIIESHRELPTGDVELAVRLRRGDGMVGRAEIAVDGQLAGRADLGLYMRMISSIGPSVGSDHGSPVSTRYSAPYEFTGVLHEVVVQASPGKYGDVAAAAARVELSRQ
jgi:arylsulfatase